MPTCLRCGNACLVELPLAVAHLPYPSGESFGRKKGEITTENFPTAGRGEVKWGGVSAGVVRLRLVKRPGPAGAVGGRVGPRGLVRSNVAERRRRWR